MDMFIVAPDKRAKERLLVAGYTVLFDMKNGWTVFANSPSGKYDLVDFDELGCAFTNSLTFVESCAR